MTLDIENDVLSGRDGWLFLHGGAQRQFEFLTGTQRPQDRDITAFFANIANRAAYCAQRGIPFLHLVHPSKPVVMRDKLPPPYRDTVQSVLLSRYIAAHDGPWPDALLYPLDVLEAGRAQAPVFRKLDTHPNDFGLFLTVDAVLRRFALNYLAETHFSERTVARSGDLAAMRGSSETAQDVVFKPRVPSVLRFDNRAYLPGNTDNVQIFHNPKSTTAKRLLVFGDSFIADALAFLAVVYRDILYVRSATFQTDILELFAPDAVISCNTERYMSRIPDDATAPAAMFALYGKPDYAPSRAFSQALEAMLSYRHHPRSYRVWAADQKDTKTSLTLPNLGRGVFNDQIEVANAKDELTFQSTGNDPVIVFDDTDIRPGAPYRLDLEIDSSVASTLKIYFSDRADLTPLFSETRTLRHPITPGHNKLRIMLKHPTLNNVLRIDPMTTEGQFRFGKSKLRRL